MKYGCHGLVILLAIVAEAFKVLLVCLCVLWRWHTGEALKLRCDWFIMDIFEDGNATIKINIRGRLCGLFFAALIKIPINKGS